MSAVSSSVVWLRPSLRRAVLGTLVLVACFAYSTPAGAAGGPVSVGKGTFLTGPSEEPAGAIVRGWLRRHRGENGFDPAALGELSVARSYPTRGGLRRLVLRQEVGGLPVLGGEVVANVAADGSLVNVFTPPAGTVAVEDSRPEATPALGRGEALEAAARAVGVDGSSDLLPAPSFANGENAELVLTSSSPGGREAWRTLVRDPSGRAFEVTVDAGSGEVIGRRDLSDDAVSASVFDYYPGAAAGGGYVTRDITPYVSTPGSSRLQGPYAYAYSNVDADNNPQDVSPTDASGNYDFSYFSFNLGASGNCPPAPYYCSWDTGTPESWSLNRDRAALQLFYQVNRYHDHLAEPPIEFTAAQGAYEGSNRMFAVANEGADTGVAPHAGLPIAEFLNNGFFSPDPGGFPAIIMYLSGPDTYLRGGLALQPDSPTVNVADDGAFVFHEYTHGLSTALISDAQGISTLEGAQGTAMSEGWSDWYAMDFVVEQGYETDTATPGEIEWGRYTSSGPGTSRPEPLDCPVGAPANRCPAAGAAGSGGFTYGDMGRIESTPEAHADGTIWSQTLWDLRQHLIASYGTSLGDEWVQLLVTAGMELSPPDPSFLDERNAILEADALFNEGEDSDLIWNVFAARGMGYFASTTGPFDAHPVEDFSLPPSGAAEGDLSGTVVTQEGAPVAGARVWVGGFSQTMAAVTDAQGRYAIPGIPAGNYAQLVVESPLPGYDDGASGPVLIQSGAATTRSVVLARDWAATTAGATVAAEVGPSVEAGCPAGAALDQNLGTGWATYSPANPSHPGPKSLTVRLAAPVNLSAVAIEPSAYGCFYEAYASASLGSFRIEVSSDGTNFALAQQGQFGGSAVGRRNLVPVTYEAPVNFVRLVGDSTLDSTPGVGGASVLSLAELAVYGSAAASSGATAPPTPPPASTSAPTAGTAPPATQSPPPLRCKKGFHRRTVKGKARCVKTKKRHRHHRHHSVRH